MRALAGALFAFILVVPSFAITSSASDLSGQGSPHVEWSMDIPGDDLSYSDDFIDLDGDGADEIVIIIGRNYTFVDPPSYNVVLVLNDDTIKEVVFVRIGNASAMEILVTYQTDSHFNISFISGRDFKEIWRSPDIDGGLAGIPRSDIVRDFDADGQPEFLLPVYDNKTTSFVAVDALTHAVEWSLPRAGDELPYFPYCIQNLDDDASFELLTAVWQPEYTGFNNLSAYDGATQKKQWTVSLPKNYFFLLPVDRFSDIDNDSAKELVLPYNSTGEPDQQMCGLNIYSAQNGTLEWGLGPFPGWLAILTMDDLNGDGWKEFLMQCATYGADGIWYNTYSVFGPKENRTLWSAGPLARGGNESRFIELEDINGDGAGEVLLTTRMKHGEDNLTAIFQIISGKDFLPKWTSRELATLAFFPDYYRPSDGSAPRLILVEQTGLYGGTPNSTLEIVSTDNYQTMYHGNYPGQLQVLEDDWNGDTNTDLLLDYNGLGLLDGNGLSVLWKADWRGTDWSGIGAGDICGGPAFELARCTIAGGYVFVNGTQRERYTSVISIHDQPVLSQLWSSQSFDGIYRIRAVEDIDNDTNIEAAFMVDHLDLPGPGYLSYVVIEFPKVPAGSGNPWPPGINLRPPTVTIDKPKNDQKVIGTVKIAGTAEDDTFLSRIEIRIDDGEWVNTTWKLGLGNITCSWNHGWDCSKASKGAHKISARAFDGTSWSSESSVTVEVRPPGTVTPDWPGTNIAGFPDPACIILMVVALIAAVAAFLVHRRRK
jgi:hypothetical protein